MAGTNIRTTDKLVHWGGEEFLLVCSNTALAQAAALGEKLRLALRQQARPRACGRVAEAAPLRTKSCARLSA